MPVEAGAAAPADAQTATDAEAPRDAATTEDASAPLDASPDASPPELDSGAAPDAPDAEIANDASTGDPASEDRCDVAKAIPGTPPRAFAVQGDLGTHDPTLIARDGTFYVLQTGADQGVRLPGKTSTDLMHFRGDFGALGTQNPSWVAKAVPQARNLWAPDLSFFGGVYHLYYSASSFGSNQSCIGHATSPKIGEVPFTDLGSVLCSTNRDNFNAIDPNIVVDEDGTPWMFFGSFWDGIRAVKLTQSGVRADNTVHRIASRNGGAIEAPVVVRRCGYYYLFVSFDSCCQGTGSTYNIRVGRSTSVLGPYRDRNGTEMLQGGGTLLVSGDARYVAAGHNAVLFHEKSAYNVYHAYRRSDGQPELRVAELVWDDEGWPISGGP